jgi:HD-like signal output (HDOD) protein/tRNA A-37 threonylcarbamoyl transferase component Bud32
MASNLIKLLVRKINELPSLPVIAQKVLHTASHRSATVQELADIIMMDPSLTAKVLRVVNSSFYGLKSQVTTVTHAIALLGFNIIKNMVLGISIFEALKVKSENSAIDHMALWEHSLACGIYSRYMAREYLSQYREGSDHSGFFPGSDRMNPNISEEAFIAGLLHDIGKILFDHFYPGEFKEIVQKSSLKEQDICDVEKEIAGFSHTEVGAWLARYWRLPRIHRRCIRNHHGIPSIDSLRSRNHHLMALIVGVSDFFVRLFDAGYSANTWLRILPQEHWDFIGLKESDYERIIHTLGAGIDDAKKAFGFGGSSGGLSVEGQNKLEMLKGRKALLSYLTPKSIDPVRMILKSLDFEWEGVVIGRDLIEKASSFEPDILFIDVNDHVVDEESLISIFGNLSKKMKGPIVMFGLNDWRRVKKNLMWEGPVLGFSMLPGRNRLIQKISSTISLNGEFNGQSESHESDFGDDSQPVADYTGERERLEHGMTGGADLKDQKTLKQMRTWLQGSWGKQLPDKTTLVFTKPPETEQPLDVGHRIGRYEIVEYLGRGGMADIYKVKTTNSDKPYALKLLPFHFLRDQKMIERFRQEASKTIRLNHPNVTKILDYGEDPENHYLIMELATGWKTTDGRILLDVGNLHKPLDIKVALAIVKQACAGLEYIHNQGLIHRDIKPENLLLFDGGKIKLSDFGIARSLDKTSMTMTGMLIGTPEYMSPEQGEEDKDLTPASDVYSLGVVMYEILTGRSPFRRKTSLATMIAHIHEQATLPQNINDSIPEAVSDIVLKCLNKSQDQRFSSATELHRAIDKSLELI